MLLKTSDVLDGPQPQDWKCGHAGVRPLGSPATCTALGATIPISTGNAIAVTCSDSLFISGACIGLELCKSTRSLIVLKIHRKTALWNDGIVKILCLDVEKVLARNCSNCLDDDLKAASRRKPCPSRRQGHRNTLKSVLRLCCAVEADS